MNVAIDYPKLHLGTAPDSWGVWMPSGDPLQTPWQRYLDEVQQAGYRYSELGPFGYLPTDPGLIREEYAKRGLTLTGGHRVRGAPQGQRRRSRRRRRTATPRWR